MTSCPRCATPLRPDDEFCTQCSEPVVPTALRTRTRVPALVAVAALLLVVGGGTAAWYAFAEPTTVSATTIDDDRVAPTPAPTALAPDPGPGGPIDPLAVQVGMDRARAEQTVGYWVPQIASKTVGMEVNGRAYDATRILGEFQEANRSYNAFLVRSDDYSTFQRSGYWVTLVPQMFTDPRAANSWCVTNGFTPDGCFAKRLSHTDPPDGNTLHWSR
jgi:hypothetical protein